MDVYSSRSRTGATAANADAAKLRAQKQRAERTETGSDRRDNARTARVRASERDTYEPGAAAYVAKTQMQKAPDQQRYVAHQRHDRNNTAESRRAGRA
jgi:hypothetical protein